MRLLDETAASLVEVLFSLVLFAIMALALTYSMTTSLHTRGRTVASSIALEIANETVEELAAVNPDQLDESYNEINAAISRNGHTFTRTIRVGIDSDRSRRVSVVVRHPAFGIRAELSNAYALWNRR